MGVLRPHSWPGRSIYSAQAIDNRITTKEASWLPQLYQQQAPQL